MYEHEYSRRYVGYVPNYVEVIAYSDYVMEELLANYVEDFYVNTRIDWARGVFLSKLKNNLASNWTRSIIGTMDEELKLSPLPGCTVSCNDYLIKQNVQDHSDLFQSWLADNTVELYTHYQSLYFGSYGSGLCDFHNWADYLFFYSYGPQW